MIMAMSRRESFGTTKMQYAQLLLISLSTAAI